VSNIYHPTSMSVTSTGIADAGYHMLSFVPRNHLVLAVEKRPTRRIRSGTTNHSMVRSNLATDDVLRDQYSMDQVAHTPNIRRR
jgi:hypothetical protein